MTDVVILVEHHEGGWTAQAVDEVGTVLARTAPDRQGAIDLAERGVRELGAPGEEFHFDVRDLAG